MCKILGLFFEVSLLEFVFGVDIFLFFIVFIELPRNTFHRHTERAFVSETVVVIRERNVMWRPKWMRSRWRIKNVYLYVISIMYGRVLGRKFITCHLGPFTVRSHCRRSMIKLLFLFFSSFFTANPLNGIYNNNIYVFIGTADSTKTRQRRRRGHVLGARRTSLARHTSLWWRTLV